MATRQQCHCGHDIDSHYEDQSKRPAERVSCLARGCDCAKYTNEAAPAAPAKKLDRPAHASHCQCFRCKAWAEQQTTR